MKYSPTDYSLTELGELCYRYGYKPEEYKNLYSVCILISSLATFGIKEQIENKGPPQLGEYGIKDKLSNKIKWYKEEVKEGVSIHDVLQKLEKENEDLSSEDTKVMEEEVNGCFKLLYEKKIITRNLVNNEDRYFISPEYYEFLDRCWRELFDLIRKKIEIKCRYIKTPNIAETDWYGFQYGKEVIDSYVWNCIQLRKEKKEDKGKIKEKKEEIKMLNMKIKTNYDEIKRKYQDHLNGLPGFVDINISLICPTNILEDINQEKPKYAKYK